MFPNLSALFASFLPSLPSFGSLTGLVTSAASAALCLGASFLTSDRRLKSDVVAVSWSR